MSTDAKHALLACVIVLAGCGGSDSDSTSAGTGGAAGATGGSSATGGGTATGGTSSTGGSTSKGGSTATGGTSATGGSAGSGTGGGAGGSGGGAAGGLGAASVLQHHKNATRDGFYVDSAFTKAASAGLTRDTTFDGTVTGAMYSQVLYVDDPGGKDLVIATTEENVVVALDASTGSVAWMKSLAAPVKKAQLPCGNITTLGITGTPVIDAATRTLYVAAMTTPDGGTTKQHLVYALSIDDGSMKTGWPVDVAAKVTAPVQFTSNVQNQRSALLLFQGSLYVAYGGHWGDCGNYHGWVVGISTSDPTKVGAWATMAKAGGIWAPGGLASDGSSFYGATGNTFNAGASWGGGEGVIRFGAGPTFTGTADDYYVPKNWANLDAQDADISGSGPLVVDLPGATPSKLLVQFGKDGNVFLVNRDKLGGIDGQISTTHLSKQEIIQAGASYSTPAGSYVVMAAAGSACPAGQTGGLTAMKLTPGAPPTIATAWCADQKGKGSPIVTATDAKGTDAIVWATSTTHLYGFDADSGQVVFMGGGASETMANIRSFTTPIVAKGRMFVGADDKVYAFKPLGSPGLRQAIRPLIDPDSFRTEQPGSVDLRAPSVLTGERLLRAGLSVLWR